MKISELARACDVPLATVKFYLREGLLPPGRRLSVTQADYDGHHVERLRLVRALVDVGGLPLTAVHRVLDALDAGPEHLSDAVAAAHDALPPVAPERPPQRALTLIRRLGWQVDQGTPALAQLEAALDTLARLGVDPGQPALLGYARTVGRLAQREVASVPSGDAPPEHVLRAVVLGTVLFEPVLLALRRLAQQHHFARGRDPGTAKAQAGGPGPSV
jgi:DNA-binding transcriptional MerR regulator